jgi:hypothetical protein
MIILAPKLSVFYNFVLKLGLLVIEMPIFLVSKTSQSGHIGLGTFLKLSKGVYYDTLAIEINCTMLNKIKPFLSRFCWILLVGIFFNVPLSSSVFCVESDGTSSIEYSPLGICQNEALLTHNNADVHDECNDCTDICLSQTVPLRSHPVLSIEVVNLGLIFETMPFETLIFTEPTQSAFLDNKFIPSQITKQLQTTILLI